MARFELLIKPSAVNEIEAIPQKDARRRIVERIQSLADEPRPVGSHKLTGLERYRLRQGSYRIAYEIDRGARPVLVVKVGHRKDVYRRR